MWKLRRPHLLQVTWDLECRLPKDVVPLVIVVARFVGEMNGNPANVWRGTGAQATGIRPLDDVGK